MSAKSNVSLIGFMGSGKTSSGQELARLLKFDFLDSDQLIQAESGLTVREIFERYGEEGFRDRERAQIGRIQSLRRTVWATGGGAWLDPVLRESLQANSCTVWLKVSGAQVWKRVSAHLAQRPLLAGAADPLAEIERRLAERRALYALADYTVETDHKTPREVAGEILGLIKRDGRLEPLD
ncbi:MAG TPA: shikimate kinase [bacterium]|nr:shikimate kinase [bacterium]